MTLDRAVSEIDFRQCLLLSAADHAQSFGEPLVSGGIVRIECKGLLEFSLATGKIPVIFHLDAAQNGVGMRQGGI